MVIHLHDKRYEGPDQTWRAELPCDICDTERAVFEMIYYNGHLTGWCTVCEAPYSDVDYLDHWDENDIEETVSLDGGGWT